MARVHLFVAIIFVFAVQSAWSADECKWSRAGMKQNPPCSVGIKFNRCTLSCKNIKQFPNVTIPIKDILGLSFVDSSIRNITIESFRLDSDSRKQKFPNLVSFSCHYCKLKNIGDGVFSELIHLQYLSLFWNPLTTKATENAICGLVGKNMNSVTIKGRYSKTQNVHPFAPSILQCLSNVTVSSLELHFNILNVTDIHGIVCASVHNMQHLLLDYITFHEPIILENTSLECFDNPGHIKIKRLSLKNIVFNVNNYPGKSIKHLSQLEHLDLSSTCLNIKNLSIFREMTNLRNLTIKDSYLRDFKVFSNAVKGVLPSLHVLNIRRNAFATFHNFEKGSLPSLRELHIDGNQIQAGGLPGGFAQSLPYLTHLALGGNYWYRLQENSLSSNELTHLSITDLAIDISFINVNIFRTINKLASLYIDQWNPKITPTPDYYKDLHRFLSNVFQFLPSLKQLTLTRMRISKIGKDMLNGTISLEHLDLSQNAIYQIDVGALACLNSLLYLNLQNNDLETITPNLFPDLKNKTLKLYACSNLWTCDCNLFWFHSILTNESQAQSNHIQFGDTIQNYKCAHPPKFYNKSIVRSRFNYNSCWGFPQVYYLTIHISWGLCIVVFLISIVYRFRWHVYYVYINGNALRRRMKTKQGDYQYDAFVAYNRMDTRWVVKVLRPVLEDVHGLKLCLHDRDWPAGVDIVENIQSSIERSRKVVLVITNAFARSDWCQLELTMAQHQLFSSDKDNLILLIKEPVLDCFMTPRLALQMKSQTYIQLPESDMGQKVFWMRLVKAICGISGSVKHKPTMFQVGLNQPINN